MVNKLLKKKSKEVVSSAQVLWNSPCALPWFRGVTTVVPGAMARLWTATELSQALDIVINCYNSVLDPHTWDTIITS